jgi:hypothetical protein
MISGVSDVLLVLVAFREIQGISLPADEYAPAALAVLYGLG